MNEGPYRLISMRIPTVIWNTLVRRAEKLETTVTWIAVQCFAQMLRDELPPGNTLLMPHKDWKKHPKPEEDKE